MDYINTLKGLFTSPEETLKSYKGKGDYGEAIKAVMIAAVIAALSGAFSQLIWVTLSDGVGVAVLSAIITFILTLIVLPMGLFISSGIYFVLSKILGGKGDFEVQTHLMSLIYLVSAVGGVIGIIPCLGAVIGFLLALYAIYLNALVLKVTHGFSLMRAIAVILIPIVIVVVIIGLLIFLGALAFAGLLAGMGS